MSTILHLSLAILATSTLGFSEPSKPNIIFIFADDMGVGDVRALSEHSRMTTPHLDKLVEYGIHLTDAHTSSSVCTPSRYSLLTGRYNWRTYMQKGVLNGSRGALISPETHTVGELLQDHGYQTACFGKWHLGLNWFSKKHGRNIESRERISLNHIDFTKPITHGPTERGFDYWWGHAASLDLPPYMWIENDTPRGVPTITHDAAQFSTHRTGPRTEGFTATSVIPTITRKACEYITDRATKKRRPLLHLPPTPLSPHTHLPKQAIPG